MFEQILPLGGYKRELRGYIRNSLSRRISQHRSNKRRISNPPGPSEIFVHFRNLIRIRNLSGITTSLEFNKIPRIQLPILLFSCNLFNFSPWITFLFQNFKVSKHVRETIVCSRIKRLCNDNNGYDWKRRRRQGKRSRSKTVRWKGIDRYPTMVKKPAIAFHRLWNLLPVKRQRATSYATKAEQESTNEIMTLTNTKQPMYMKEKGTISGNYFRRRSGLRIKTSGQN